MELSDLHHPSCKLNRSHQGSFDEEEDDEDDGGLGPGGGGGDVDDGGLMLDEDDRSPVQHLPHHHHVHHLNHMGDVGSGRRDSDLSDAFLSPEAYRATQAVEFIAEHLRNEDEYVQVNISDSRLHTYEQLRSKL